MAKSDNPLDSFLSSVVLAAENSSPDQSDAFWVQEQIDASRWNAAFPYQLIVVKRGSDGKYHQEQSNDTDGSSNWIFTLPFPPESLNINMPMAIAGSITQGGYVEEHGGAPIRQISLSGSLGVLPLKGTATTTATSNLGAAIFAGTIQQVQRVAKSANSLVSDITGNNANFTPNLVAEDVFSSFSGGQDTDIAKTTGYYQLHLLRKFFENYTAFKLLDKAKDYRLALCLWKHQAVYLVTPQGFNASYNAASPLEPLYQLQFRAYRRITLDSASDKASSQFVPVSNRPNGLQSLLNGISDARNILENARDIVSAVGGDLDHALFEPIRQVSLFLKDALSVPLAFADLPVQVLNDCQSAIVQYVGTKQALLGASDTFVSNSQKVVDAYKALADLGSATSKVETGVAVLRQSTSYDTDAALNVFAAPKENFDLFNSIKPSQVSVPPAASKAILAERNRCRALKRLDFQNMRDSIAGVLADFSDAVGAGNSTYNRIYGRPTVVTSRTPTESDFQVIFALNRTLIEMNTLAASGAIDNKLSSINYVAGLATRSGIAFKTPKSKFQIPFPYGLTIEQVAYRYLGSPDRWIEIAALNGLRAPFVDEEGFDLPLLTNGSGNEISVASSYNLYIGQQVWISSATTPRAIRRITKIKVIADSNSILTVDGDSDLARFSTLAGASIHAFLPNTVNSQMTVYIPSDNASLQQDEQLKAIPGLNVYDQLLSVGGVDLLLTEDGDLAITPDGDCRLAVGLQNIIQTARTRLAVKQGTLNRHPTFGLPIKAGQSVADLSAQDLLKAAKNLFTDDPAFSGVQSAAVLVNGPTSSIAISVGIRGSSQYIPLTFTLA